MLRIFCIVILFLLSSCKTTTYYISRHAEKAGSMSTDPPLTPRGEKQTLDLAGYVSNKKIEAVYSTNFIRTRATAQPTSSYFFLLTKLYDASRSAALIDSLKAHNKRNVLIVGHSNTVDDIVNAFMGKHVLDDLPDSEYGPLFIVKKRGSQFSLQKIELLPARRD